MSTTPIGSYRLFQKLHPLSLLAQLTSRRATGCLSIFTGIVSWSIYLEDGKLTYASYSDKLFERLDSHLRRLSQQIPALNSATRVQMRLMFETKNKKLHPQEDGVFGHGEQGMGHGEEVTNALCPMPQATGRLSLSTYEGMEFPVAFNQHQSIPNADYQAICWLVNQGYITSVQAGSLIDELAKEVLESFLCLKEGSYEFSPESSLDELPKFCRLDLRLLVEHCQKQLRNRQNIQSSIPAGGGSQVLPAIQPAQVQPQLKIKLGQKLPIPINFDIPQNHKTTQPPVGKKLYTIACIDDSQTVLNSIKHFLDENTFSVVMINDPVKALMQILRSKPDLILLDVEMPSLDGYELCSLLRKHSAFKNTPIIMVTGRTGFIDRAKAKIVRSSGYLTKPFTQSELLKMVFKHLG